MGSHTTRNVQNILSGTWVGILGGGKRVLVFLTSSPAKLTNDEKWFHVFAQLTHPAGLLGPMDLDKRNKQADKKFSILL